MGKGFPDVDKTGVAFYSRRGRGAYGNRRQFRSGATALAKLLWRYGTVSVTLPVHLALAKARRTVRRRTVKTSFF